MKIKYKGYFKKPTDWDQLYEVRWFNANHPMGNNWRKRRVMKLVTKEWLSAKKQ